MKRLYVFNLRNEYLVMVVQTCEYKARLLGRQHMITQFDDYKLADDSKDFKCIGNYRVAPNEYLGVNVEPIH